MWTWSEEQTNLNTAKFGLILLFELIVGLKYKNNMG